MAQQQGEWHKAKVFSLTHLLITLGFVTGATGYMYFFGQEFGALKSNVARHEIEIKTIRAEQVVRDNAISSKLTDMRKEAKADNLEMKKDMQRISDKIDRLIERQMGQ